MMFQLKKVFFIISFNFSLFFLLMIGIQNSHPRDKRINLIISESIQMPIAFIVGVSFISGSVVGSILKINFSNNKN